jgi:hypothetical protein
MERAYLLIADDSETASRICTSLGLGGVSVGSCARALQWPSTLASLESHIRSLLLGQHRTVLLVEIAGDCIAV